MDALVHYLRITSVEMKVLIFISYSVNNVFETLDASGL